MKKCLILLLCLLMLFFCFIYRNSPEKAVLLYNKINMEDNKILNQTTINRHLKILIAINNKDIYFYILNKNHLNHWKVVTILGSPKKNISNGYSHTTLTCNKNIGYKNIFFGTIDYKNIKTINKAISNKECKIVKLGSDSYAWYYLTDNSNTLNIKFSE